MRTFVINYFDRLPYGKIMWREPYKSGRVERDAA